MIDFGFGVKLGSFAHGDVEKLRSWRNHYSVWKYCRQGDLIDDVSQESWYLWQSKDPHTKMYLITAEITDRPIGVCGLTSIDWIARKAEFSLYISPDDQGRGHAAKALKTLFNHGFLNLNLNLIWGESFNPKAIRIFESLGMAKEGVRRDFYFKEGKYLDATLISIRRSEWSFSAQQLFA